MRTTYSMEFKNKVCSEYQQAIENGANAEAIIRAEYGGKVSSNVRNNWIRFWREKNNVTAKGVNRHCNTKGENYYYNKTNNTSCKTKYEQLGTLYLELDKCIKKAREIEEEIKSLHQSTK